MFLTLNVALPSGGETVDINLVRRGGIGAPEMVIMDATLTGFDTAAGTGTYNPQDHEIYYLWDVGEDSTYSAPVNIWSGPDRHPNGHKNARYSYSPTLMHTFRTAGAKVVSLSVYEPSSGKFATANYNITVGNPDTVFAGTNTIFMSPGGDFTDAPSGAQQVTSGDIVSAVNTYVDGQETTPKRIVLNRGETFTWTGKQVGAPYGDIPSFTIVAGTGAGADPVITLTGFIRWDDFGSGQPANSKSFTISECTINGSFSSTTTGSQGQAGLLQVSRNGPGQALINECTINDAAFTVLDENSGDGHGIMLSDNACEGRAYHVLMNNYDYFGVVGNKLISDPAGYIDANNGNQGWAIRCGGADSVCVIHSNDIYSMQGWSGYATQIAIAQQNCLRLNPQSTTGASYFVFANNFEGGFDVLGFNNSEGADQVAVNSVLDGNYVLATYGSQTCLESQAPGLTIRNCIFNHPDQIGNLDAEPSGFVRFHGTKCIAADRGVPIKVYNNTYRNGMTNAVRSTPLFDFYNSDANPFTAVTHENNVEHQPLQTGGADASPLGDDTNIFTPREAGYQSSTADYRASTATQTTAGNTDLFDPETGAAAIGAASTGLVAYRDFRGIVRNTVLAELSRSTPSKGHIEPNLES